MLLQLGIQWGGAAPEEAAGSTAKLEPIWLSFSAAGPRDSIVLRAGSRIFRFRHLTPLIYFFVARTRFLDPYWTVRSGINFQVKDVESVVMPNDVMDHFVLDTLSDIDIGHHHALTPHKWIAEQFSVRPDDHRDWSRRRFQQLFHAGIALRKLLDGIGIERARGNNIENLALEGMGRRANADRLAQIVVVCAAPRAVEGPRRGISGNVDLLPLCQEREPSQSICILTANESPNTADIGLLG